MESTVEVAEFAVSTGRRLILPLAIFQANEKHPFPHAKRIHPIYVRAGEKLGQERRESGGPWRSKNRPPEICLRKRSQEERFLGYRRDVHSGAICTRSARGLC